MSREEFIDRLRISLKSGLAPSMVEEHVRYYEEYIRTEINKGKAEQEILASLGDPRLIARTIIETNTSDENNGTNQSGSYEEEYNNNGYGYGGFQQTTTRGNGELRRMYHVPGWVWILVTVLIIIVIIGIVMSVLSFLAPILIPILLVLFLVKLFRDWLN